MEGIRDLEQQRSQRSHGGPGIGRGLGASRASKSYFAASGLTTRAVFRVIVFAINFIVEIFTRLGVSSNARPVGSLKLATAPGPSTVELLGVSHLTREVISGHQGPSELISGHQWSSVAIRSNQRPSAAIGGH